MSSGSLLLLLRELSRRDIEYIVIGGMAGVLHGAPVVTADLDIVHRRTQENVAKLLVLLDELDAMFRGDDRRLKPNESHLLGRGHVLLTTSLGQLDVLCEVSEQLKPDLGSGIARCGGSSRSLRSASSALGSSPCGGPRGYW